MSGFSYQTAFSRYIGSLTSSEQAVLRGKRIAVAGMSGVGVTRAQRPGGSRHSPPPVIAKRQLGII